MKSAFLYIVLSYAIYRYVKANDIYSKVIMLFGLYIILVTCLLIFELAWPQIPVLFFILMMSSMAQYWQYVMIFQPVMKYHKHARRFECLCRLGLLIYIFIMLTALGPMFGPYCRDEKVYSGSMRLILGYSLVNWAGISIHIYKKWWLDYDKIGEEDRVPEKYLVT